MSNRPIHYEPHPVSRERKAELIAAGFRIVDAKFKPKDAPKAEEKPAVDVVVSVMSTAETPTTEEIKAILAARGTKFRANASRDKLVELLNKEA